MLAYFAFLVGSCAFAVSVTPRNYFPKLFSFIISPLCFAFVESSSDSLSITHRIIILPFVYPCKVLDLVCHACHQLADPGCRRPSSMYSFRFITWSYFAFYLFYSISNISNLNYSRQSRSHSISITCSFDSSQSTSSRQRTLLKPSIFHSFENWETILFECCLDFLEETYQFVKAFLIRISYLPNHIR